jgi:hypothetical protein
MMNLAKMSEITELPLSECRNYRIEYLNRHIRERNEDIIWLADDDGELSAHFAQQVLDEVVVEVKELQNLIRLQRGYTPKTGAITPEMIEAARAYPIGHEVTVV